MKIVRFFCWAIGVLYVLFGCSENKTEEKVVFRKVDTIQFKLDDESTGRNKSTRLVEVDEGSFLSFLNEKNNSLYFYDLKSTALSEVYKLNTEGENGVGKVTSYYIDSLDSIYVYSYGSANFSLLKNDSIRMKVNIDSEMSDVRPQVGGLRDIESFGGYFIFNSWGSQREYYANDHFANNSFLFLEKQSGAMKVDIPYPDVYKNAVWGVQLFQIYHDLDSDRGKLVIQYPIDGRIFIYDLSKYTMESFEVIGEKSLVVEPLSNSKRKVSIEMIEEIKLQKAQDVYSGIKFLKDKDLYIRFVDKALSDEILKTGDPFKLSFGPKRIQVISSDFELLGEFDINGEYFIKSVFFYDGKIYLEKIQFENEDVLVFDIFNVEFL